jgi:hypothetical protein
VTAGIGPTVLKRYVAIELRRLREAAALKREDVAARLRRVTSHIMHVETARNLPNAAELEIMLDLYGAQGRTAAFLELLESARKGKDWFAAFAGSAPEWFNLYLGMENAAVSIDSYDCMVIRGLFQTPAYAESVIRAGAEDLSDDEVYHRVQLRMARQDVLTRRPVPPTVWSVLDEAVLRRAPRDKPAVLSEQIEHLVKLTELPNVHIQILPLDCLHAGIDGGTFTVLTFGPELIGDPGCVYGESHAEGTYVEKPDRIMVFRRRLQRVQAEACAPEETRAILTRRLEELTE